MAAAAAMPRYLAQNFLAEAQTHRRVQLERMLVAPPRHIEFLEAYAHKGLAADEGYLLPWRREEGFQCPLSTLEMVKVDLVAMVTSSDGDLEHYSSRYVVLLYTEAFADVTHTHTYAA